jgi:hypothetical protein
MHTTRLSQCKGKKMTSWINHDDYGCPVEHGKSIDVRYNDGTEEMLIMTPELEGLWGASKSKYWRIMQWRYHIETPPWRNVVDLTTKAEYSCPHCKDKDLKIEELTQRVKQLTENK